MSTNYHNSEKGQAIVYLVVGLIVFLGFVALAIDGGMALADRRHSQNAADSASLAGGGEAAHTLDQEELVCIRDWTCNDAGAAIDNAESAAISRADANGFNIGDGLSHHNGVVAECVIAGKFIDVTVDISSTTTSNFLQLIYPKALHNEVDAVTRVFPRQPIALDDAVIGLNPASCANANDGVSMYGNGDTLVDGGNIFSNGCIRGSGNAGTVKVTGGGIVGHDIREGNMDFDPTPTTTDELIQPSDYYIKPPTCTTWYNDLPNETLSGLYCMTGNLSIQHDVEGYGVTIYVPHGHVVNNGNAVIKLYAPSTDPEDPGYPANPPAITGVLFFVANGGYVTLDGTADDTFSGMIYAPQSDIKLTGNAENIFFGQVIGWNVSVGGNDNMTVNYDDCNGYTRPPSIELAK